MANDNITPDDGPAPDAFEAELVAYLDGEVDDATARKVEAQLARDPAARTRAAELKKSFDLLDYLPRAEPSATFTTRTLDKLPPVKPTDSPPREPQTARAGATKKAAPGGVSTSVPLPLDWEEPARPRSNRPHPYMRIAGRAAALLAFVAIGYLASAAARPYLFPRQKEQVKGDPEARVIEHLPLYAAADDVAFVAELARPDLFGEDPAVSFDPALKIPPADVSDKPTGLQFESLLKVYRSLPPARQAAVVKLDQDLHAKEPKERDRLFRVLEVYAAWLARLPEADRRAILGAATPSERLKVIRAVRDRQWLESLPPPLKAKLAAVANPDEKKELIQQWKDEEAIRRDRWAFIRQHVEAFASNNSPWPFDTERGRNEVPEFAKNVFKTEDNRRCRLSGADLAEYRRTLNAARSDDAWAWYGLMVYELNKLHPYLPEPENPKLLINDLNDLPFPYAQAIMFKKGGPVWKMRAGATSKWPEFPLELHELPFVKSMPPGTPQLGPSRLSEFKQPVREFANKDLFPKMTGDEKRELERLQGKWPEYPQRYMHYAHKYDLSVPGVSLPGSPKKWEATYGLRTSPRPNN